MRNRGDPRPPRVLSEIPKILTIVLSDTSNSRESNDGERSGEEALTISSDIIDEPEPDPTVEE